MSSAPSIGGRSAKLEAYDIITSLVSAFRAIRNPRAAALYRAERSGYRTYVAGELDGPNQNFRPKMKSADAETRRSMATIVGRCRDQAQNNPNICGAIRRIINNVVRSGIRPQFTFRAPAGKLDRDVNKLWEDDFKRWARYASADGHDSLWALQRLGLRHMWHDGGYLIHRVYDESIPGVVPLRLELLELDHLDKCMDGVLKNGNTVSRGKEFDASGKPVAYWIYPSHPGDTTYSSAMQKSLRIPAEEIIDVYDRERISQRHGVPWIVSIVMEAYDLEDYRSYERMGAKVAAAFGAFIKSAYPEMGGGLGLSAKANDWPVSNSDAPTHIEPSLIQWLPQGTDITFGGSNRPGNQYEPYVKESRRTQSVPTGMSYESYANDYTDASYSSTRSGALEERLSYQGQQFFLNEKVNARIIRWYVEAAWLSGLAPMSMPGFARDPYPYFEAVSHQNPGWIWQDPQKDGNAAVTKIEKTYSSTYRKIAAEQGHDWDEVLDEAIACEESLTPLLELRAKNRQLLEGGS